VKTILLNKTLSIRFYFRKNKLTFKFFDHFYNLFLRQSGIFAPIINVRNGKAVPEIVIKTSVKYTWEVPPVPDSV
jgi:hypothetical protein